MCEASNDPQSARPNPKKIVTVLGGSSNALADIGERVLVAGFFLDSHPAIVELWFRTRGAANEAQGRKLDHTASS